MTLDEAITYAENMAALSHKGSGNAECEQNHRQLAEWLRDYKWLLEQESSEDCISRKAALGCCRSEWEEEVEIRLKSLPPVNPQPKTGRWMPIEYDGYADGYSVWDKWECSECGWEHSGDEESLTAFCPNCGAKMEVKE